MTKVEPKLIYGKKIEEWDREWVKVPGGLRQSQPQLRWKVGLYRVSLRGEIAVIGQGIELKAGLAKRFSDFRRPSPSGRNHHAGRLIYEHRELVEMEVLITGADRLAQEIAKQLKTPMIERHNPTWTAPARSPQTFDWPRKRKTKRSGRGLKARPYTGTIPKG